MDLFSTPKTNLLPYNGEVIYCPNFIDPIDSKALFNELRNSLEWRSDEVIVFGKKHRTKRKVAWFGDLDYGYSNNIHKAMPFPAALQKIKLHLTTKFHHQFNGCLLNLYHNGDEGMGWHADDEKELGINPTIASISLGVTRKFKLKHRAKKTTIDLTLEDGSLLIMKGETQTHWQHSLPKSKKVKGERINLTFRLIYR